MGILTRQQFPDFFLGTMLPALEAKVFQTFKAKPKVYSRLFNVESTVKGIQQYSQMSGVGLFTAINELGEFRTDQPVQGYDKTFQPGYFGLGIEVSKDVVDDDKIGLVKRMAVELGFSCWETIETQAAAVFNNAFATNGLDGVPLCSTSHPLIKAGGVQSNILSVAADLDVTSIELALTDWELLKKSNGQQMSLPTPRLVCAPANRWTAYQIAKAGQRSETANNTVNALQYAEGGAFGEVLIWSKLTDPDAWFLAAPPESTGLLWLWRHKPYTRGGFDDKTEKGWTAMKYKSDVGWFDYIGLFGTPGV